MLLIHKPSWVNTVSRKCWSSNKSLLMPAFPLTIYRPWLQPLPLQLTGRLDFSAHVPERRCTWYYTDPQTRHTTRDLRARNSPYIFHIRWWSGSGSVSSMLTLTFLTPSDSSWPLQGCGRLPSPLGPVLRLWAGGLCLSCSFPPSFQAQRECDCSARDISGLPGLLIPGPPMLSFLSTFW